MGRFTFRKEERLSKEKHIQELFDKGSSFYLFPFKVFFMPHPDPAAPVHQILISVSKRNFKRAVDRNLIKRRMREAYRLNKERFPAQNKLVIAYIYSVKDILPSVQIHERLVKTIKRFEYVEKN
ncbi:ribonuclease P protein component [Chryseolinea lacunae]|uniref:Ribonuclease P protein component n=1 Tax=Chryseolinea lacunae TaxID=2801331 RepID=A0ABS1KSC0_9BACT|nr:ribonuclease P protein component [Chryseolinea lacunae]MBL0742093.1 ribonuclease P protein component [Chryseolinea lacunae]